MPLIVTGSGTLCSMFLCYCVCSEASRSSMPFCSLPFFSHSKFIQSNANQQLQWSL
jgi:hypothetical protein